MDKFSDLKRVNKIIDHIYGHRKNTQNILIVILLQIFFMTFASSTYAATPLAFYSGFESDNFRTDWKGAHFCSSHSITTVKKGENGAPSPRGGKYMARFELRPTDKKPSDCKKSGWSARAEMYTEKGKKGPLQINEGNWIGWSIYVPKNWDPKGKRIIVTQVHGGEVCDGVKQKKPQLVLNLDNKEWGIANKWDKGMESVHKSPLQKGVWTDWALYYYPSLGDKGLIKVWKNGKHVATKKGSNICKQANLYLKTGIYHSPNSTLELYVDEVRIGNSKASFEDVAPREYDTPNQRPIPPAGLKVWQTVSN